VNLLYFIPRKQGNQGGKDKNKKQKAKIKIKQEGKLS
jgi:hypothetical protein